MKRLTMLACLICLCFSISCSRILDALSITDKIHPDQNGVYYFSIDNVNFTYSPATITMTVTNPTSIRVRVNVKRWDAYSEQRPGVTLDLFGGKSRTFQDDYRCGDEIQITVRRDGVESICYLEFS